MFPDKFISNKVEIPSFIAAYPEPKGNKKIVTIIVVAVVIISLISFYYVRKSRSTQDNRYN